MLKTSDPEVVEDENTIVSNVDITGHPQILNLRGVPHAVTPDYEIATAETTSGQFCTLMVRDHKGIFGFYVPMTADDLEVMVAVGQRVLKTLRQGAAPRATN